jgi:hypothetical protein|tara:strand:- start:1038 stop:1220 length:183 start_codon:yes stop_codon:yes gene_type:complete
MRKRVLDQFDLEAEREGTAIRNHNPARTAQGKGIVKQRKMHSRGQEIITTRIVKRGGWLT